MQTHAEVYKDYINDVYRYAYFQLRNREQAEDVSSEAFLRLFEKDTSSGIGNMKHYLIGITRNLIFEKFRQKKPENIDYLAESGVEIESDDKPLDNEVLDSELLELIKQKLDTLDENTREVIILKIWEGLKFNEIAKITNESEGAVKLRYYRGIENLKILLGESDKSKKVYSFSLPIILGGVAQLATIQEFKLPDTDFLSLANKLGVSAELIINNTNMDSIISNAVSSTGGIMSTLGAKVVAGVGLTGVVVVSGVLGSSYVLNKNNIPVSYAKKEIVSYTNVKAQPVYTPPITSGGGEEKDNTKVITFSFEKPFGNDYTFNFKLNATNDSVLDTTPTPLGWPTANITNSNGTLTIISPYEAFPAHYDNYKLVEGSEVTPWGKIYRVVINSDSKAQVYTNSLNLTDCTDNCLEPLKAPWGSGLLGSKTDNTMFFTVSCNSKTENNFKGCDDMVKSLVVNKVSSQAPTLKQISFTLPKLDIQDSDLNLKMTVTNDAVLDTTPTGEPYGMAGAPGTVQTAKLTNSNVILTIRFPSEDNADNYSSYSVVSGSESTRWGKFYRAVIGNDTQTQMYTKDVFLTDCTNVNQCPNPYKAPWGSTLMVDNSNNVNNQNPFFEATCKSRIGSNFKDCDDMVKSLFVTKN